MIESILELERRRERWAKIKKLINRFEIKRFPIPIRLSVPFEPGIQFQRIILYMRSMDRENGNPTELMVNYNSEELLRSESPFDLLRSWILSAIVHELDECLYVDGERRFDPHKLR